MMLNKQFLSSAIIGNSTLIYERLMYYLKTVEEYITVLKNIIRVIGSGLLDYTVIRKNAMLSIYK